MSSTNLESFQRRLPENVQGEVHFGRCMRGIYATDASNYQIQPVAIFLPRDRTDVQAAVRTAVEHGVSIVPRGGGTSLGGQPIGAALVIDFTKYLNRILELNVEQRWARVEPGLVLDQLNAALAEHGLHFAPDPATSNRATIGGMIGNNSSGTKSIIYGRTSEHVLATTVLLAGGEVLELERLLPDQYASRSAGSGREAQILGQFRQVIDANRDEIERRYPKVMRQVTGYALNEFVGTDQWNLAKLMVGSEGTLATVLEAKVNLEPLPKHKSLCVVHFAELLEAIPAVQTILEHSPSAVEIMDRSLIGLARENLSTRALCDFVEGDPAACLIVEFFADSSEQAAQKAKALTADLGGRNIGYAHPIRLDAAGQARVWAVRKSGLGLLLGMKGDRKPIPFIEDSCVPIEVLPEYIEQVLKVCKAQQTEVAMYAHASVGTIHVRPILDLKRQDDIDRMKAIAEQTFELVIKYGGAWSGEHGDGLVRSPFMERYFGSRIYDAFRQVKRLFDPDGLMNPGKIVDAEPMDCNLRYGTSYTKPTFATGFHYRGEGGFAAAVEMCNGQGACRQTLLGTMCPSYQATRDEQHSTRGRANALRLAMTGQLGPDGMTDESVFECLDLCLSCKGCKSECPSNVDMARLKGEFLQKYRERHGTSLREKIVCGSSDAASRIAGWKAPLVNRIQRTWLFRKTLELVAGFDSRRELPEYARQPFTEWFADRPSPNGRSDKKVVLFDDTYMKFHEPNVGISAVELLESCGYEVVLARAGCCQRPRISHGFLVEAKRDGEETLRALDTYIRQGLKIVVCEPGCASALTDDLPDLIDDDELGKRISENVMMIDVFLAQQLQAGSLNCRFTSTAREIVIHGHCHQKSLYGTTAMKEILARVPDLPVTEIDSGCCGMGGSFGYEKEHYELSLKVGEDRLFPAIRAMNDGTTLVACGFSCRHQIAHGTGVKPVHWVETVRGANAGT